MFHFGQQHRAEPGGVASRVSINTANDDSDYSGSLTPGQMQKWNRRHIVQEEDGPSIFPKIQAPSVDLTLHEGRRLLASSSDTLSPLGSLRAPGLRGSSISPRDHEREGDADGSLTAEQEN